MRFDQHQTTAPTAFPTFAAIIEIVANFPTALTDADVGRACKDMDSRACSLLVRPSSPPELLLDQLLMALFQMRLAGVNAKINFDRRGYDLVADVASDLVSSHGYDLAGIWPTVGEVHAAFHSGKMITRREPGTEIDELWKKRDVLYAEREVMGEWGVDHDIEPIHLREDTGPIWDALNVEGRVAGMPAAAE